MRTSALSTILAIPFLAPLGLSQTASVEYRLGEDSDYIEGCFPPCLCPIWIVPELTGTFLLTPTGTTPGVRQFAVGAVDTCPQPNRFPLSQSH